MKLKRGDGAMSGVANEPPLGLLVCIGDLVEDVIVWTAGPLVYATDNPSEIVRTRGGSAANVAVFASAFGPVRFIGRVGDDALGRALVDELVRAGVEPYVQRAGRTGSIVILVDALGERTMYPDRAAAAELADVPTSWVAGAGAVHAPAYCFATPESRATTLELLNSAHWAGATVSLDVASVSLLASIGPDTYLDLVRALAPHVLFANADEAAALSLDRIHLPATTIVIKDGPEPVLLIGGDGSRLAVPVPPVPAVRDTTGAGDAFAAGYLTALLAGATALEAAGNGNKVAASVLSAAGAVSIPSSTPQKEPVL
jgi:sugar/nucleoside kinase (ribokinase family)